MKKGSWGDMKSAESLARYMFKTNHKAFLDMLKHQFTNIDLSNGYFEYKTKFDEANGPREHDLMYPSCQTSQGLLTIGIEAKGNEPYDVLIYEQIKKAEKIISKGKRTELLNRVNAMFNALTIPNKDYESFKTLRYQLFSGLCGTIAEANKNKTSQALFLILQFETTLAREEDVLRNKVDLEKFLKFLNIKEPLTSGHMIKLPNLFKNTDDFKINYVTDDLGVYLGYLKIKL